MSQLRIHTLKTISTHNSYHGWPTVARLPDGELLVVASAGRERHVCPFGQVHLLRSSDNGTTWSEPEILANGPLDDRDAGILYTSQGTLLVNWFTSINWLERLVKAEAEGKDSLQKLGTDGYIARCQKIRTLLTDEIIKKELGVWMLRSTDGGKTWEDKYLVAEGAGSPHGPAKLADGTLLFVGNWRDCPAAIKSDEPITTLGARLSRDDGRTWELIGTIPERQGDIPELYCEPHALQLPDGRLITHIRNHNERDKTYILQSESTDGGKTWSEPHNTGLIGYPAHLLLLKDGRILTSYGYRNSPRGNRVALSKDGGKTWNEPIVLDEKTIGRDLGYPSSVELPDSSIISIWYERLPDAQTASLQMASLQMAHWSIA